MFEELPRPLATAKQLGYIDTLLDLLDASLEDYTDKARNQLTVTDASDLIDTLKDDVSFYELWPKEG